MKYKLLFLLALFISSIAGFAQSLPNFPCDLLQVDSVLNSHGSPFQIGVVISNHDTTETWGPTHISIVNTSGDTVASTTMCGCVILFKGKTGTFYVSPQDSLFRIPPHYCCSLYLTGSGSTCPKQYGSCLLTGIPASGSATASIQYFPNPSEGLVSIDLGYRPDQPVYLTLYNVRGSEVFSETLHTQLTSLDLSGLSKGLYLARMYSQGTVPGIQKLILR